MLTQADVEAFGAGPMPCQLPLKSRDGSEIKATPKPLLAKGKVTFAGEAVAMVIAETYAQAKDAAELVEIDYDMLDACGTLEAAPNGPQIWDGAPGNLCFDWAMGDEAGVKAALDGAAHKAHVRVVQNRIAPTSMETRNASGLYDPSTDKFTLYSGNQGSANIRGRLATVILNIAEDKLHIISPDVGGGFGMKGFIYPEQALVLIAAKKVGRPVRWSADRSEAFLADDHGRDMITEADLALDKDGRILAMHIHGSANMGGYLSQFAPFIPTLAGGRIFGGLYKIPAMYAEVKGYFTNSAPIDAYRGAGRPEAAYLMERLMDEAARVTGIDRVELRQRNLPTPDELPYKNWFGLSFDSGDYPHMLSEGLKRADVAGFAARRKQSEARGRKRGLGIAYYVEITAAAGSEPARVTFTDNGGVVAYVGTQSNGQGHETAFAQVVAERLGVPFESVTIKQGDTDWVNGGGTGGSRSLNMAGGALQVTSDEVIRKGKRCGRAGVAGRRQRGRFQGRGRWHWPLPRRRDRSQCDGHRTRRGAAPRETAGLRGRPRQRRRVQWRGPDLPQWLPCLRSRSRSGNRQGRCRLLCGARRFRSGHQSDAGAGPGPWRGCAGARSGVAGELRLRRRERPAHDGELHRLCDAARRRHARYRLRL